MTGNAPEPSTYHWVMTVLSNGRDATLQGTHQVKPGETRQQVFFAIHDYVQREMGVTSATVLFFALEPDRLS